MGHKIHPTGLRLGITQEHRSRWYAPSKTYPTLLQEDDRIRKFIHKKYSAAGISDVLIARKADQLEVELKTARPGVLVGRQGSGIEELRAGIQKTLGDASRQVRINVVEVERVDADAYLLAEYIAQQLEKRVAFRRVLRMTIQRAQRAGVLSPQRRRDRPYRMDPWRPCAPAHPPRRHRLRHQGCLHHLRGAGHQGVGVQGRSASWPTGQGARGCGTQAPR